jgi:aryl-alcohol dehydrogenase-like predicted oxidoreductase
MAAFVTRTQDSALRRGSRRAALGQWGFPTSVPLTGRIDGRTKQGAGKQLDESLRRLQVDYIDLVQHHEILRYEDLHRILDEAGPMRRFWRRAKRGSFAT